jgi:hypothetical protein
MSLKLLREAIPLHVAIGQLAEHMEGGNVKQM